MAWVRLLRLIAAAILTLALIGCDPSFHDVVHARFDVRGSRLIMNESITAQTPARFDAVIAANPGIRTLVLQDVPGSTDDDALFALGYRVRKLGLATHVTATSEVHSGGVDLFIAGVRRTMEPGARFGVHSWTDGVSEATDYPTTSLQHFKSRKYVRKMLGDESFYWFTINAAPADGIHLLSPREIRRFGLLTQ